MSFKVFTFVVLVAICNFWLNFFNKRAANEYDGYFNAIASPPFLIAFTIGIFSVLFMLKLYSLKEVNLSQAILLMGSLSIIGGSLAGHFIFNQKLTFYDWILFTLIAIWYLVKVFKLLST